MSAAPTSSPAGTGVQSLLTEAATAAAALMPSPAALLLGPTDGSLVPDGRGTAVTAAFTGAVSGTLAVVVDPVLEAALAAAESGPLPVEDAVLPALQAASAAIGPAVLSSPQLQLTTDVLARGGFAWAPLVGDGEVLVWVGLQVSDAVAPLAAGTGAGPAAGAAGDPGGVPGLLRRTEMGSLNLLRDVEMTLTVELGRTSMPVRDLLSLAPGSVVELDRAAGAPADLMVNGRLLARGEIVVVDEDYGMRITEIVDPGGEA